MINNYSDYYDKLKPLGIWKLFLEALHSKTNLRRLAAINRMNDYRRLFSNASLLPLHKKFLEIMRTAKLDSYDYGEGYFYQSSSVAGITGFRDTAGRTKIMNLQPLVVGRRVLEVGCNTGFLSLELANYGAEIVAFDSNPYLIQIAFEAAQFFDVSNVRFEVSRFEDFKTQDRFDVVLAFANHETVDGNSEFSLCDYLVRCRSLCLPGGLLLFESHPAPREVSDEVLLASINKTGWAIESHNRLTYGTFLDRNRLFVIARNNIRLPENSEQAHAA